MNTLSKNKSLKSKKLIRLLFSSKSSVFIYPFKVVYSVLEKEQTVPVQMLISVGKRKIKTAVARNHIKRLFREAYRLNCHLLMDVLSEKEIFIALAFVYVGDKDPEFKFIEEKVKLSIEKLAQEFSLLKSYKTNSLNINGK